MPIILQNYKPTSTKNQKYSNFFNKNLLKNKNKTWGKVFKVVFSLERPWRQFFQMLTQTSNKEKKEKNKNGEAQVQIRCLPKHQTKKKKR